MQKPIPRKSQNIPKNFILPKHNGTRRTNLYTFNNVSTMHDSGYNQNVLDEANPEDNLMQSGNTQKVYYDVQTSNNNIDRQLSSKMIQKSIQFNSKLDDNNQDKLKECDKQLQQGFLPVCHRQSTSGFIAKQTVQNKGELIKQKSNIPYGSQRQFNRLALSLMGIKRTKFSNTCMQKRTSFNIQNIKNKRQINNSQLRYSSNTDKSEGQIYQQSAYPFSCEKIQRLKQEINRISSTSRVKRKQSCINNDYMHLENKIKENSDVTHYNQIAFRNTKQQVKVSMKTSQSSLKNLLSISTLNISVEVPTFFSKPPSELLKWCASGNVSVQSLGNQCAHIFSTLGIQIVGINIRKYSNCLVIVNHNICIVWHANKNSKSKYPDGKRFIGQWKNKYFDQGEKHGMGLEWAPNRYVYYGQFKQNKRNGFGFIKRNNGSVFLGYWRNGKQMNFGIQKNMPY